MENLKVSVSDEIESKEAQELFFELGYKFSMVDFCEDYNSVQVFDDGSGSLFSDHDTCSHKELTIPQLRDLVVLKRNDVNDANFCYGDYKVLKLQTMDYKIWDVDSKYWVDHIGSQTDLRRGLIHIDKKMTETEHLMQGKSGERLMESVGQLNSGKIVSAFVVDGEEKHSHYKKSVKHLDFIDPYRIAQLYDLHPCADHIAKKALCTGKRGHKDLMRDIQDIIDTAERWKQMIQEDQNAI